MLGGCGTLMSAAYAQKAIELNGDTSAMGTTLRASCGEIGISLRTLKRWWKAFLGVGVGDDRRLGSPRHVFHRLSEACGAALLSNVVRHMT